MSLRKQYSVDTEKEIGGVDIEIGEPDEMGNIPTVRLARQSKANKAYSKALEAATRPYRRQIELETLSNELSEKIFMGVFVDTVVLSWNYIKLSDVTGNEEDTGYAPFNRENATALFKALPELYDSLNEQSKKASLFRDTQLEGEAKN